MLSTIVDIISVRQARNGGDSADVLGVVYQPVKVRAVVEQLSKVLPSRKWEPHPGQMPGGVEVSNGPLAYSEVLSGARRVEQTRCHRAQSGHRGAASC
jgi:hypothetical protein